MTIIVCISTHGPQPEAWYIHDDNVIEFDIERWARYPRLAGLVLAHELGHRATWGTMENLHSYPALQTLYSEAAAWAWAFARRPYRLHERHVAIGALEAYRRGLGLPTSYDTTSILETACRAALRSRLR